jgi:hypothetical protein
LNIDILSSTARAELLRGLQTQFQAEGLAAEIVGMDDEMIIRFPGHSFHTEFGTRTASSDPKVRRALTAIMKE